MTSPATSHDAKLAAAYRDLEDGIAEAKSAATVAVEMFSRTLEGDGNGEFARMVRERVPGLDADLRIFLIRDDLVDAFNYSLLNVRVEILRLHNAYHARFEDEDAGV